MVCGGVWVEGGQKGRTEKTPQSLGIRHHPFCRRRPPPPPPPGFPEVALVSYQLVSTS